MTQVFRIISLWFIIRVAAFLSKSSRQAEGKQQTSNELRLSLQMLQPTNKRLLNQSCCQNKLEYSQASDSLTALFQLTAGVSDGLSQQCPALSVWAASAAFLAERWLWGAPSKHCYELQAAVHHICMLPCDWWIRDLCDWSTGSLTAVPIKSARDCMPHIFENVSRFQFSWTCL